jgi:hypothetical protein
MILSSIVDWLIGVACFELLICFFVSEMMMMFMKSYLGSVTSPRSLGAAYNRVLPKLFMVIKGLWTPIHHLLACKGT